MKTLLLSLALLSSTAFAEGWSPRIDCNNGEMVVDGYQNFSGAIASQLVVRDGAAIAHLASLVDGGLVPNEKRELVVPNVTYEADGSFSAIVKDIQSGSTLSRFSIAGRFLDWNRYELRITHINAYPGMTYHEADTLGNWVFNGCRLNR